jgi:hypothetical protein
MSSKPSFKGDGSLFGLDIGLDEHLEGLDAAKVFAQRGNDMARCLTLLRALTLNAFGKGHTKINLTRTPNW